MARHIHLEAHLSVEELGRRYRRATDPVERSRWQMLWLLGQGQTAQQVAAVRGYSAYWIGQIAQRYNRQGQRESATAGIRHAGMSLRSPASCRRTCGRCWPGRPG